MIVLNDINKSIKAKLGGSITANQPEFVTTWTDKVGTTVISTIEGSSDGVLNGTGEVIIVANPGLYTRRVIENISITNSDTVEQQITISLYEGTSSHTIAQVTLQPEETWTMEGTFDEHGAKKVTNYSRITPRNFSDDSGTLNSITPNIVDYDAYSISNISGAFTINNSLVSMTGGEKIIIKLQSNGSTQTIILDTEYRCVAEVVLPTEVPASGWLYIGIIWNSEDSMWDIIARSDIL